MKTRIYVAGASAELERARAAMARVVEVGHAITHDWTRAMDDAGPEHLLSNEAKEVHAFIDLEAVNRADVLWFLLPTIPSAGAWFEFGYFAQAIEIERCTLSKLFDGRPRKRIVISGAAASDHIFVAWAMARGAQRYQTDGEAAVALGLVKSAGVVPEEFATPGFREAFNALKVEHPSLSRRPSEVVGRRTLGSLHGPVQFEDYDPEAMRVADEVKRLTGNMLPSEAGKLLGVPSIEVYRMRQGEVTFDDPEAALSFIRSRLEAQK